MTCMYLLPEEGLGIILMADMNDYLVGTDLLDRLGWNLVLDLLGEQPGRIDAGEYWLRHGLFDLLYAALSAAGIISLVTLPRFRRKVRSVSMGRTVLCVLLLCFALPTLLLMTPSVFLSTPLWVVAAFVPDLHLVLWAAALMLYASGIIRLAMLIRKRHPRRTA